MEWKMMAVEHQRGIGKRIQGQLKQRRGRVIALHDATVNRCAELLRYSHVASDFAHAPLVPTYSPCFLTLSSLRASSPRVLPSLIHCVHEPDRTRRLRMML